MRAGLVSFEEGFCWWGNLDSMLFEFISRRGLNARMFNIGVEGAYLIELSARAELCKQMGVAGDWLFSPASVR